MPARKGVTPWVEKLIWDYDSDEGVRAGVLQAHVVRVDEMSQSQALGSEGPTGLLYLSDEQVQIPAVLTTSAWEQLQEDEELESFRSLLHRSVCVKDFRLLFHRSVDQTRSRFYLSVGKMSTMAVKAVINNDTLCCTSLPSVRTRICETWRALLGQHESQKSQSGFDLTELLGEWQKDCLQPELEHVQKLLTVTPQPSTSTINSAATTTMPDTCTGMNWAMDLTCSKGNMSFSVPVQYVLIPDTVRHLNVQPHTGSEESETSRNSSNLRMSLSEVTTKQQSDSEDKAMEDALVELNASSTSPAANPWDMCPPPNNTSSTTSSPQASPASHSPIFNETTTNLHHADTSTQASAPSKRSQSELPAEPSLFPPYQRPPASAPPPSSSSSKHSANTLPEAAEPNASASSQETENKQLSRKCRKALRNRTAPPTEDVIEIDRDEEMASSSPPSWMFDSLTGSTSEQSSSQSQAHSEGHLTQVHCLVHSDGRPFSYTYQVKGQELQHLSHFTVTQDLLQWAARYLLKPINPEQSTGISATEAEDPPVIIS